MVRTIALSGSTLALFAACAATPLPRLAPARVAVAGDPGAFGPGLAALSDDGRLAELEVPERSSVAFFNVHQNGWVELLKREVLPRQRITVSIPLTMPEAWMWTMPNPQVQDHERLRSRDALLVVIWSPSTADPHQPANRWQFQTPRPSDPASVPITMFGDRPVRWVAYLVH